MLRSLASAATAASAAAAARTAESYVTLTGDDLDFKSRRSAVVARHGMVASSQPLASVIGVDVMRRGGNAVDAAIAVAAALAGLGGDCFLLYYDAKTKQVSSLNGSGRAASGFTLDKARAIASLEAQTAASGESSGGGTRGGSSSSGGRSRSSSGCGGSDDEELDSLTLPPMHAATVTVPGAAQGWCDAVDKWGSKQMKFAEILEPAAALADEGFPVAHLCAYQWSKAEGLLSNASTNVKNSSTMLLPTDSDSDSDSGGGSNGLRAPREGEVFRRPELASVLRNLGAHGRSAFYEGTIAHNIAAEVQALGGFLTVDDLKAHTSSSFEPPISTVYKGIRLHEVPPNGQGLTALLALDILTELEMQGRVTMMMGMSGSRGGELQGSGQVFQARSSSSSSSSSSSWQGSVSQTHALVECMRIAFADTRFWVCDPVTGSSGDSSGGSGGSGSGATLALLNKGYAASRAQMFDEDKCALDATHGCPERSSSTVSFQVVDPQGNAVSMVNSNYMGFGTGIVPKDCGFSLHNRGHNFSLDGRHPNAAAPSKRPYHTIIPALTTFEESGELHATMSNMGGFMQPQGHVQLLLNLLTNGMTPQAAVDAPRFCIRDGDANGELLLEEGFSEQVVKGLQDKGHAGGKAVGVGIEKQEKMKELLVLKGHDRAMFRRAQMILKDPSTGVLWGASDGRADGCAVGW